MSKNEMKSKAVKNNVTSSTPSTSTSSKSSSTATTTTKAKDDALTTKVSTSTTLVDDMSDGIEEKGKDKNQLLFDACAGIDTISIQASIRCRL
jgi:CCR4-NOT transcriptional regulation complex NOT5 subunit